MWFSKLKLAPRKPLILVVDDDIHIVQMLRSDLLAEGYEVAFTHDGFTAKQMAWDLIPDLIILDIVMPGLDGLETLKLIHQRPEMKTIPVILVSGQVPESTYPKLDDPSLRIAVVKKPLFLPEFNLLVRRFLSPTPLTGLA